MGITFGRVTDRGLAVNNLTANSALVRAGLRAGDFIVSVNGHRLERVEDFDRFAVDAGVTDRIKVIVLRDGREDVVYLEPTVFYADESYDDDYTYFGVVLDDRYPDRLIVLRVYPDSSAFIAGLREGDEINSFHGQRLKTRADLGRVLHGIEPGTVDFEFSHDRRVVRARPSSMSGSLRGKRQVPARMIASLRIMATRNRTGRLDLARLRIRNRLLRPALKVRRSPPIHRRRRIDSRMSSRALPRAVSRRRRETSPVAASRPRPASRPVQHRPQARADSNRRRRAIPRRDRRRPIVELWTIERLP